MDTKIGYKKLPRAVDAWINLESKDFLDANPEAAKHISAAPDGTKNVLHWKCDEEFPTIDLGRRVSMGNHSHLCFKVYNKKATGTSVMIKLNLVADNDRYIQGGVCGKRLDLDFEGWKEFRILRDHLTVAYPPPFFDSVSLVAEGFGLTGKLPENEIYLTSITAEREQLEIIVPEGVDINSPELYEPMLEKYAATMNGTPDVWDYPQYIDRVEKGDEACEKVWAQFKETWCGGEKGKLFGFDIQRKPWVDEYNIMKMYQSLLAMTLSYTRHGSKFYQNAELLEDIKLGLEYMYKNYYGENLYTSTTYGNWWPWWIGTPGQYLGILVLLRHELGRELVVKYASTIKFLMPFPYGSGSNMLNMAKLTACAGALLYDAEYICTVKSFVMKDLDYFVDTYGGDGGFYRDGSFIQHSNHPYIRGYGLEFIRAIVNLMNLTQGSAFEFTEDCVDNQYRWIFENYRHQIVGKNFSACNAGREVTRGNSELYMCRDLFRNIIYMRSYAPPKWQGKLDSLIKAFMLKYNEDFSYLVWPHLAKYCVDLYNDDSVIPEEQPLCTRVFGRMARAVHHGEKYGATLSLSSKTIHKYESINKENEQGWYFSDGFLFMYPFDNDYDYDGHYFWHASPYLRASVTINTAERIAKNLSPSMPNASNYAGGVECGKYGSVGFILGYNNIAFERGTHKDKKDITIEAKKSWFFLDDEIVCLGSGIKDASGTPVITCVENRMWRENDTLTVGGKTLTPTAETEISAKYAHFTNMGGYVFLDENKVTYNKTTRGNYRNKDDKTTYDFAEIVIHHGVGDGTLNGSYAYAYLPTKTVQETAEYSKNPDFEIVQLNEKAHALYEKKLGIFAANFFEADTVKCVSIAPAIEISAKTPCSIMIKDGVLYVSDPTGELDEIELTVNGKKFSFNTKDTCGKTFSVNL